jgi:hypothetical protein
VGRYGTDLTGFGAFEGGVNADKGAPLVSTSSDGETALLFGPAALREIQAGVANGDFAIPPDAAGDTITAENPLPYWTFTDNSSSGAITCAIVADSGSGSGNLLRWSVAAGTTTGKTATLSRYVAVPATRDSAYSFWPEMTLTGATNTTGRTITLTLQFYTQNYTTTGTAITRTYNFNAFNSTSTAVFIFSDTPTRLQAPSDAAFAYLSIAVNTTATNASVSTVDLLEVRMLTGGPAIVLGSRNSGQAPAMMWKSNNQLSISPTIPTATNMSTNNAVIQMDDAADGVTPANTFIGRADYFHSLSTYGDFDVSVQNATDSAVYIGLASDAPKRLVIDANGKHSWSDGSNAADTNLYRSAADTLKTDDSIAVVGNIGFDGVIYGSSGLTGIALNTGGTNGRLWIHSNPAADVAASTSTTVSGVLITKATAGQPSTNINGTATTDAFADALRNGGIAVDTTNNRGYFYSGGWKYAALTTPSDSRLKEEITEISGALDTLRQLVPVAFKWKRPEAHGRSDAVADDGTRLGFIADQVATTDLAHWVETLGVDEREADLVDTTEVLAVNIPQNEMEALVVQALLDIDARLKALESR